MAIRINITRTETASGFTRPSIDSGQITSYADGDAGDLPLELKFFTLPIIGGVQQLNYFGSKWRFTGLNGGYYDQTTSQYKDALGVVTTKSTAFPNNIMLDHYSRDFNNDILAYNLDVSGYGVSLLLNFDDSMAYPLTQTIAGKTGWRQPQPREVFELVNDDYDTGLGYHPINMQASVGSLNIRTAATPKFNTTFCRVYMVSTASMYVDFKTSAGSNIYSIFVRKYNISEL